MPISLPDSPTDGQTVQIGTIIYTYDATVGVWNSNSAIGPTLSPASSSTTVYADMAALIAATGMSNGDQHSSQETTIYTYILVLVGIK